jgi:hypothetical protein
VNIGVGPTRTSGLLEERVYVSRDNGTVFDPSTSVSVLSLFSRVDLAAPLRVGDTLDRTSSLLLPIVMAGDFYIHVQTNMNGRIFELNRENNIGHSARLTVFQTPPADLSVSSLTPDLPDGRARSDRGFRVRVTVKNLSFDARWCAPLCGNTTVALCAGDRRHARTIVVWKHTPQNGAHFHPSPNLGEAKHPLPPKS